jgi:hypothetical protein
VDEGLYESLLTERLNAALAARPDLRADIDAVDDAEQPLTLARHLTPLIERSLRAVRVPAERAELVRRILAVLPDPEVMAEALQHDEPGRIERLEAVVKDSLTTARLPRPATPLGQTRTAWSRGIRHSASIGCCSAAGDVVSWILLAEPVA